MALSQILEGEFFTEYIKIGMWKDPGLDMAVGLDQSWPSRVLLNKQYFY